MSGEPPEEKACFPLGSPGKYSPGILFSLCLCQFRYKKRVYKQSNLDEKQLAKLHSKVRGRGCHRHCSRSGCVIIFRDQGSSLSRRFFFLGGADRAPAAYLL